MFITSEGELPDELKPYQIRIRPERMHDALAYASLMWGESFTIPSECSILGVPSIINHDNTCYYLKEQQEKYGLCYFYSESEEDQIKAIEKGVEILSNPNVKNEWKEKRDRMLRDKIDVTSFFEWFVENYSESKQIINKQPDYQFRFR